MTEFASEAIVPVDELTTDDDTTTDARTEGDDDEVLHTTRSTIGHLTDSGSVSVVGEGYGDTDAVLDHLSQGNLTLPREVGGELDRAVEVVTVRRTYTDTTDLFLPTDLLDEHVEACDEVIQVELNIVVRTSLDRGIDDDITTGVDDTEDGVRPTEVYTYYIGLFH